MMNTPLSTEMVEDFTSGQDTQEKMLNRIGHMTRALHDSLRGLGFDKLLEKAANDIPDARDRLEYVARMTEQAADKVLNAIDLAMPLQDQIAEDASTLKNQWQTVLETPSFKRDYDKVAQDTLNYLDHTHSQIDQSKALLMQIMMAQDFQDLTGQVIKKITELAQNIEQQLVQVLIDFTPEVNKKDSSLLNGPQIKPEQNVEAVANQEQVDDLLESLGF
jgi:chemotaxis protein CheZ